MGATLDELGERMTAAEFAGWMSYYQIEPFGSRVDDIRAGLIASAVTTPWGGKTAPGDWLVWQQPEPTGTWRDLKAAMGGSKKSEGAENGESAR